MKLSTDLAGRRVLVTGGTTGVGRATASLLAGAGSRVFICGRNADHLADALREVRKGGGEIEGISLDVGTADNIGNLFAAADAWMGGVDIAILNAGLGSHGELTDMTHEECREIVSVNLLSYISCSLEAMKRMRGAGGHIVMTGSMSAHVFDENAAVYTATKCGVRGFATSLRKEANPHGIKVSYIEPGCIGSDMVDETPAQQQQMIAEMKMLKAEDVARSILFLLSQPEGCDVIALQIRPHLQLI